MPLEGSGKGQASSCQVLYLLWVGMLVSLMLIKLKIRNPYQLAKVTSFMPFTISV